MGRLRVSLFGKFSVRCDGKRLAALESQKVQELLAYLLINRKRPHVREKLATLLWENSSTSRSKSYLRQTLWQLQSALEPDFEPAHRLLLLDSNWIQINPDTDLRLDVAQLEQAFTSVQGKQGRLLNGSEADMLREAVQLYNGDLLENWYQDWCIFERERLQNIYLALLDKLMGYCEWHEEYEAGINYGTQILGCDLAHERTYRRLMRLYYFYGDRTKALRIYERCSDALFESLGVKPSRQTAILFQEMQADQVSERIVPQAEMGHPEMMLLPGVLERLAKLRTTLIDTQHQVERDINVVRKALNGRR